MNDEYRIMENANDSFKITRFTDLNAWQKGHQLVLDIYRLTEPFPIKEQYGLTNQMRRASVSITSNIAEGFSRQSFKEKIQFYSMSKGSLTELQNQLIIAKDIGYISLEIYSSAMDQTTIIHKIINGLIKSSKSHHS